MSRVILSILMIAGTSLGGAMIAMPAILSMYGYTSSILLLVLVWLFNLLIAFLYLEANFYIPEGSNFLTITRKLLGKTGVAIAWVVTLCFFLQSAHCIYYWHK